MSIAMFQKVVRTIIYAPYQFRQDFDDFIHRFAYSGGGNQAGT